MKELVFIENEKVVTDSLTIADMFGKQHGHIIRDIKNQIELAGEEFAHSNFGACYYTDKNNRQRPKYNLTEEAFTLVVFSYNTREAVQTKIKFIQEFKRMREALSNINVPSYSIENPIERAKRWIKEEEERQRLQTEKLALESQMKEVKPKVEYCDTVLKSENLLTISQIAKDYGLSGQKLNKILQIEGIQYKRSGQWFLYQNYSGKGFTKSVTYLDKDNNTRLNTCWTQTGRMFIHNVLTELGYKIEGEKREQLTLSEYLH